MARLGIALIATTLLAGGALAQTTYTWIGGGTASWAAAASWSPARTTPAADDIMVFNAGGTVTATGVPTQTIGQLVLSNSSTVNLQGAAVGTILTLSGGAGTDLDVPAGSALNLNVATNTTTILLASGATGSISGNMTFSAAAHKLDAADASAITFNNGAIFTQGTGCTGNVFTNAGTANAVVFASGSRFHQAAGANPFGLSAPNSKVVFQTGSLFRVDQNSPPAFSGRTYANFEVNIGTFSQSATGTGGLTVDNLTMTAGILNLNLTGANPIHVRGNISVASGATLTFNPASAANLHFSGTSPQTVSRVGTLTFAANSAITISNPTSVTLNNSLTFNGTTTINSGSTLATAATLTNSGTMNVNGAFRIEQGGFAAGNNFVYAPTAGLVFNNTSGSYGVSSGHVYWPGPAGAPNVNVMGAGGITMNVSRTVSGSFETAAGVINGNNLTLEGAARINSGGFFIGSPTYGSSATLIYNVTGGYGVGDEWTSGTSPGSGVPRNVTILQSGGPGINLPSSNRTVPGNLTIFNGSLNCNGTSGDLLVGGDWSNSGTFNPNNRAVFFNGTGTQNVSRAGGETFDYLLINKASGDVVLGSNATVSQVLTFLNGKITTGGSRLVIAPSGSISGANSSRYVNGNLQKQVTILAGAGSQTFEVGDASVYAPISFSTMAGGSHLQIVANTTPGDHAQIAGSGLDAAKSVNRHWSLALDAGFVGNYDATFNFAPGDVDGGATTSNFIVRRHSGGNWFTTGAGAANPTSTQATAVNGFGEFQVGEAAVLTLSIDDVTQAEGNGGMTFYDFTVSLSAASLSPVTVEYTTADGSATEANNDYKFSSAPITFNPGETTKPVQVTAFGDQTLEADESFFVNLFNPTGATIADGQGAGTLQNDDGLPVIDIELVQLSLESAGPQTFQVSLSNPSDQPVSVDYQTVEGSATLANNDFVPTSGTLTFPPKSTTPQPITVTINDDAVAEGDETYSIVLSNPSGGTIGNGTGTGTIQNDDGLPVIDIELVQLSLEGAGSQTFQVSLSNPSDQPVTVDYQTFEGSATLANNDFVPASGTLTFPAKSTSAQPVTVTINDDAVNEGDETYTVVLSNPSGGTIGNGTGTGTIQNDDGIPTVSIVGPAPTVESSGPRTFFVTLSNPSDQAVSVDYQTIDGSATTANNDYESAAGTVTFPPKTTTPQQIVVLVNDDAVFEGDETFSVDLSSPVGATIGAGSALTVIQNDDGQPTIDIELVQLSPESAGTQPFDVMLSNPSDQAVTVEYQTFDGSATLANNDYVSASGTVTFPPKSTMPQTITVTINDDAVFEGDETFTIVLSNPVGGTIGNGTGNGVIQNDDGLPVIDIELVQLSLEGAGPQTFQVSLSNPSDQPVSVDYQTANGSASTANGDYVATGGTLTFPPKSTAPQPITVTINDDAVAEGDETYSVVLSNPSGGTIGNGTGTGTIQNDDGQPTVSIVGPAPTVESSGPRTFFVLLSNPSDQPVTVGYQTVEGSATVANNDFVPASGTVTFPPKTSTPQPISVTVNDDAVFEGDEDFSVTLSNPVGATIAGSGSALTVITNDDAAPAVSVDASASGPEDGGTITINFTLSSPTDQLVTVDWNLVDGTATTANFDYSAGYGTIGIPAKTVGPVPLVLDITADGTFEADETFTIVLSNPTNATIGNGTGTLTIQNDDGAPTVSIDDVSLAEGDAGTTAFTFTVSLSNPTSQPVTVDVETADVSTTSGIDYAPLTTTVTIPAKALSATVDVDVFGDITNEGDETFVVNLSNAAGATIGDGQGQGTIVNDDDTVPPSVVVSYPNGGELFDIGATVSLMWSASDNLSVTSVDLYLSRSGIGGPYETIALGESNDGQYDWVVTGPVTAMASLRVVVHDAAGNTAEDESDDEWAIDKPTATLVARFEAATLDGGIELRWSFGDASLVADRWVERTEAGSAWSRIAVEERDEFGTTIAIDRNVAAGRTYEYRLVATTRTGERVTFGPVSGTGRAAIAELAITSVTPTPTRGPLRVDYALPREARVRIGLVDVQGREVAVLVDATQPAGRWQASFDGIGTQGRVPAGVYFVRMSANGRTLVKRAVVAP